MPDPDMLSRILCGHGLENMVRRLNPLLHQTMRQAADILEGKHKPRAKTVVDISSAFASVLEPDTTRQLLRGEIAETDLPRTLPWRHFRRSMGPSPDSTAQTGFDEVVAYLAERESFYARLHHHQRARRACPELVAFQSRAQEGHIAWRERNPELFVPAFLLIDEFLHAMAHFDTRWGQTGSDAGASPDSALPGLLAAGRRPMGHWLSEVARACGASSLPKLAEQLFKLNVRYKGENKDDPFIKVDLLKKWSASRQILMPLDALEPVLSGVPEGMHRTLEWKYFVARMLTFLVALVRAGTKGEPPTWEAAQEQIKSRYNEVYRLQVKANGQ